MAKEKKEQVQEEEVLTTTDSNEVEDTTPAASDKENVDSEMSANPESESVDAQINSVGVDAPSVKPPREMTDKDLHAFVKYLAARTMASPEYNAAKQAFPQVLDD